VVVTSYSMLRREIGTLETIAWSTVVLDEAQRIKNPDSTTARAACRLKAKQRLALSGTPVENNLLELWSLFRFLEPGLLGSKTEFLRQFVRPIQQEADPDAHEELRRRIRPLILRRLRREVASDLPPLEEIVVRCEMGPEQRAVYEHIKSLYRARVGPGTAGGSMAVLEALTRLRQTCCSPALLPRLAGLEPRDSSESCKLNRLMELLDEARAGGHRSLVFSQWPSLLQLVKSRLDAADVNSLFMDGQTGNRDALVKRWNRPDGPPVFLVSLQVGGTALTLTGADHVVHLDPWWNPAAQAQATARAHRIGQQRPVVVHKLICTDSVEEKIMELHTHKQWVADATINTDRLVVRSLAPEDITQLLAPLDGFSERQATPVPRLEVTAEQLPQSLSVCLANRPDRGLSNTEVRRVLGCTAPKARQHLMAWVRAGLLERTGERRGTRYILATHL
jgi:SNF2 family DNA or RNA helicase